MRTLHLAGPWLVPALCAGASLLAAGRVQAQAGAEGQPVAPSAAELRQSITPERVMGLLRELPAARASNGDQEHREGLRATERLLTQKLKDLGYEPVVQAIEPGKPAANIPAPGAAPPGNTPPETPRPGSVPPIELPKREPWNNLIVEIPGQKAPAEVLVLTAHFDAAPGAPGADDDGTGTVAVLELARVLKGAAPARTIRLILFNQEEVGLLGSIHYVKSIKASLEAKEQRIVGMVSLEMLGYFTDKPNSQRSPIPNIPGIFEAPTVGDFIALTTTKKHSKFAEEFGAAMRRAEPTLKVFVAADFIPDLPITPRDLLRSDHAPFLFADQPGTMLTDTSNFRNPHYHKPTDTPETIDAARFASVVRAVAGAAEEIAGLSD